MNNGCFRLRGIVALYFLFCCWSPKIWAQTTVNDSLKSTIKAISNISEQLPIEKLYLQADKPGYIQNDTLWFKAYLLNADYLTPSTRSGLLYVELDDNNNKLVKRIMVPLISGLSWGDIALDEADISAGNYTLRAYTNWMQNFGDDYIFCRQIYIASPAGGPRFITTDFKATKQGDKTNIQAALLFNGLNRQPVRLQDMQLRLTDGNKVLLKDNANTGIDGQMNINFNIAANTSTKNLSIIAQQKTKDGTGTILTIPVTVNRPENTDLQFMPEGGTLVAGNATKIAFKAIGEDGEGADVSGIIENSRQQQVAVFKSRHKGMGAFMLTPQAGESYTALLTLPGGTKSYLLPAVSPSGVTLGINHTADSLLVNIAVSPGLINAMGHAVYLIGQARGVVCYAARIVMKSATLINKVPKSAFPEGIARFTLLSTTNMPLAERMVYINHDDNLKISIAPNKKQYAPHDSIALNIKVTDKAGNAIRGSFSLAVTDNSQVKIDTMGSNIVNNILLTSDLKGNVEEPAYYFENNGPQRMQELDDLLLTQGWVGYNWNQVFGPVVKPIYSAEPEFMVQGGVTNMFNKPVAGSEVTLLSKKPVFVRDTLTDKNGRFTFKGFLPVDTAIYMIQARNKRGKSFNVGITMDEFTPPVFVQNAGRIMPWYVNSDTLLLHNLDNTLIKQQQEAKLQGLGHVLKEVVIKDKKVIKNSKNLNGPGGADQILDEQDMLKAGKLTLADLLTQKIKGFREGYTFRSHIRTYFVDDEPVHFIFDGMYLDNFYNPTHEPNSYYNFVKPYLDYYSAEDITGIEIMYNERYSFNYIETYMSPYFIGQPIAFIEITTRAQKGPFMKTTPGTYLYKPMAFSLPAQFYRPRYTVKKAVTGTDLRSTIYWAPNIITDTAGRATISFYSADKPATYTIVVEGTNLNGQVGFKRQQLTVH